VELCRPIDDLILLSQRAKFCDSYVQWFLCENGTCFKNLDLWCPASLVGGGAAITPLLREQLPEPQLCIRSDTFWIRLCVCCHKMSVYSSVTIRYCVKTAKHIVDIFSPQINSNSEYSCQSLAGLLKASIMLSVESQYL